MSDPFEPQGRYVRTPRLRAIVGCLCDDVDESDRPCVVCEGHGFVPDPASDQSAIADDLPDAVVRADMAEAELEQLLLDARMLLGLWHAAAMDGGSTRLPGLDDDEVEELAAAARRAAGASGHDIHRALRNVLALAELPSASHD